MITSRQLDAMLDTAKNGGDPRVISALTPRILCSRDKKAALQLAFLTSGYRDSYGPELLALLNMPDLRKSGQWQIITAVFKNPSHEKAEATVRMAARIGRYGFSFPQWRFLSQAFNGKALLEHAGMKRLRRDTDTLNPALPDPDRDRYGVGFIWQDSAWYIEYRRAYILIANHASHRRAALIIRNNSWFFGRDRLPHPGYVSFGVHGNGDLRNLSPESLDGFIPLNDLFAHRHRLAPLFRLERVNALLDRLDAFDRELHDWLWRKDAGLPLTLECLKTRLESPRRPYITALGADTPPWFPARSLRVSAPLLDYLAAEPHALKTIFKNAGPAGGKTNILLLSGRYGDFPVRPSMRPRLR